MVLSNCQMAGACGYVMPGTVIPGRLIEYTAQVIRACWENDSSNSIKSIQLGHIIRTTMVKAGTCSNCLLLALFYLQKLKARFPFTGQDGCGQRFFLAALLLAGKFLHDEAYNNNAWSKITGIPLKSISAMELEMLKGLKFNLYVSGEDFAAHVSQIKACIASVSLSPVPTSPRYDCTIPVTSCPPVTHPGFSSVDMFVPVFPVSQAASRVNPYANYDPPKLSKICTASENNFAPVAGHRRHKSREAVGNYVGVQKTIGRVSPTYRKTKSLTRMDYVKMYSTANINHSNMTAHNTFSRNVNVPNNFTLPNASVGTTTYGATAFPTAIL
eukprot:Nk52_evm43s2367 gene=Nk52_evmTU43s2367